MASVMVLPEASTMARWMQFSSSRTLPGQVQRWMAAMASSAIWLGPVGCLSRNLFMK
ncbi:MAG: hypothetical protein WDO13_01440 [Verrucomicrobiota bacterium]